MRGVNRSPKPTGLQESAGANVSAFDRVLVLETAGRVGQVALVSGDDEIVAERLAEARRRASDLAVVVQRLLCQQGWKARDLTGVVVGLGPGSFTGLRVGLASAKALAYAAGCAFFGVETFAAIAARAPSTVRDISVVADALQGKLYRRDYRRRDGDGWQPTCPLQVVRADQWIRTLPSGAVVSGPAAEMFVGQVPTIDEAVRKPRPIDLITVAKTCPWGVTTDAWLAEPLYVRGSSAEEKAAARMD
jgi:tRNA threonylcarbamoyladenosine biosynthesis protein TsaB